MICRHYGTCGGCDSQDVPYPEQLLRKQRRLEGLLRDALGAGAPAVQPIIGMPVASDGMPWRFRHKAAFAFEPARRAGRRCPPGLVMGHYARGSKVLVPVDECPVHAERANRLAFALRDHLQRAAVPAAGPRLDGVLRHVVVRTTADEREAVVMLVVARNDKRLRAPIRAFLAAADAPTGFLINVHDRPGSFLVGRETIRVHGSGHVREERLGTVFVVSPTAFFQTNLTAARVLLDEVTRQVEGGSRPRRGLRILDLYAGSGLFALPLAARAHTVTAVEENAQAVHDAAANLGLNGIACTRVRFVRARVEDALRRCARERFDAVVLDPPRQGCPPAVIDAVFGALAPPWAVYVSCNPEALATELPRIVRAGYCIQHVQPVDMFPHTMHIEVVVTLTKNGPGL